MTSSKPPNKPASRLLRRPPIHMIDEEAETLTDLALQLEQRLPQVSELLLREIERAKIYPRDRIGADVVTMYARVRFVDAANGRAQEYQLVYPKDADIAQGRISILTPVGAGLIGLRQGQSILWPDRDGHERELQIVAVVQQAPNE